MADEWKSQCGRAKVTHADCQSVLLSYPDSSMTVVTDPPYGIREAAGKNKSRGKFAQSRDYGVDEWDNETNQEAIDEILRVSGEAIIFGGNFYNLPPSSKWLVWDKENGQSDFADCELAWTNLGGAVRLKRFMWHGMLRANKEPRGIHPTQKPVSVMQWAIGFTTGPEIVDPFCGSGTTGIAALRLGRIFWGIERSRKYYEAGVDRIKRELCETLFL